MDATMDAPAMAVFDVPPGCTELTPYGWCNIHGLWAGETVPIPVMTEGSCQASQYPPSTWTSIHADFVRQQKEHFNSTAFFTEADGVKHTPYITIGNDRNTASILVGTEPDPGKLQTSDFRYVMTIKYNLSSGVSSYLVYLTLHPKYIQCSDQMMACQKCIGLRSST